VWLDGVLGVGFLEQCRPELVVGGRVDEDKPAVERRESVVDDDVDPGAVLPDVEVEHAGVVLDEQVVGRNDVVEQVRVTRGAQRRSRRQEPAVACGANNGGRKCADTLSAQCRGSRCCEQASSLRQWPFLALKYKYIFQIKYYTEAIYFIKQHSETAMV